MLQRINTLESALKQARAAIMRAAKDTLWVDDCPAETVVDRIDAALKGYEIVMPKYSNWQLEISPGTYLAVREGRVPNWLQRKAQELVFGFRWVKS